MSLFTWIQFSLFVVLLHSTALTGQLTGFVVRDGDQVTLPFGAEMQDQYECNRTTWRFTYYRAEAVELVVLGQISENAKSDRLSVAENCSLVIKEVTAEDAGYYVRRLFNEPGKYRDFHIYLYVMNMTEQRDGDNVTLSCSVSTFAGCSHTATWLYEGEAVDEDSRDMQTSRSDCSVSVTFHTSFVEQEPKYHGLFRCHVYDHYHGKEQLFAFRTQSSGDDATSSVSTAAPPTTQEVCAGCSAVNYIMLVLRVAELLLITVITVLLIRARRNHRPPDDNTLHRDATVNYENYGDASASVNFHANVSSAGK